MEPISKPMAIPVEFENSGSTIRGTFFPSPGIPAIATVIFLQGLPGVEGDELICKRLSHKNVNVLTFNYRGTFRSQGYFSILNAISDIGAALKFIKGSSSLKEYQIDPAKLVLGGWSFGASLVPVGAIQNPEFSRIFALSGRDFGSEARKLEQDPEYAKVVNQNLESMRTPKGPITFRDDLLSELGENRLLFDINRSALLLRDRSILLVGGWDDSVIEIENFILPFYRCLKQYDSQKVTIQTFQDDHEFFKSKGKLVQEIVRWLKKTTSPLSK